MTALAAAAQMFKALGHEARLDLALRLTEGPQTVGALIEATGLSQPLVSQHLRTLRLGGLVVGSRDGKEVEYRLTDDHVSHVVLDAVHHASEPNHSLPAHEGPSHD